MPEDGVAQVRTYDAIYLGAVGFPGVPDHVSLWGLLIPLRRELDQYANVRPVRLLRGVQSPLSGRSGDDIDFVVVTTAKRIKHREQLVSRCRSPVKITRAILQYPEE